MLYLVGPAEKCTDNELALFFAVQKLLKDQCITCYNPHKRLEIWETNFGWLGELSNCDGIVLLDGWYKSPQARVILSLALESQTPVYKYVTGDLLVTLVKPQTGMDEAFKFLDTYINNLIK